MIGILNSEGEIVEVVASLDGVEAPHGTVPDVPPEFVTGDLLWDGSAFVENLPKVEADRLAAINVECERVLAAFASPHPLFEAFRAAKREELRRWAEEQPSPVVNATTYPFLYAESELRELLPEEIVAEWTQAAALWASAGAQLEAIRVAGRAAVRAAPNAAMKASAASAAIAAIQQLEEEL
jgi:hypothetical protein